jgi:hypothetical protein
MRERKAAIPNEGTWPAGSGRNPRMAAPGVEARTAATGRTKSESDLLMEQVVERSNMRLALKRVVQNRGSAGVDGLTVAELNDWLKAHWPRVKEALLAGGYMPQPVRRVDIPKPQGGVRTLGVPTVVDRLIQLALQQVLQPIFEATFSASSYGFRPGRDAAQAVQTAAGYIRDGRRWVVDIDLEKFFDRVNHDMLMARVARRIKDRRVLKLIRRFLEAGMMADGLTAEDRGHAAGRTAVTAAVERAADGPGPGTGAARLGVLPLCGRLQHLRPKRDGGAAGDGGRQGVPRGRLEAARERGQERGGATVETEVPRL